jgi:hypothetical protein
VNELRKRNRYSGLIVEMRTTRYIYEGYDVLLRTGDITSEGGVW